MLLRKANFNPNQPRIPAGNPGGGRWTATGGTSLLRQRIRQNRRQRQQQDFIVTAGRRTTLPRTNRANGHVLTFTPAQQIRGNFAIQAINFHGTRARALDPNFRLRPIASTPLPESYIRGLEATARHARRSVNELLPLGFPNYRSYENFGTTLSNGLRNAGYRDVQLFMRGSSVTGVRFSNKKPFDSGPRPSDYDVAIVSPTMFARAVHLNVPLRGRKTRTEPLNQRALSRLGLLNLRKELQARVGRDVSFMIYTAAANVHARPGPNRPIVRSK
ncbi:MAG: hypothetical protein ACRBCJ_14740 [Hyphomicrobiaceae bacterium]